MSAVGIEQTERAQRVRGTRSAGRWLAFVGSVSVIAASGIFGMAPASAAACGSATSFSGTYEVIVTANCEWTPPALVTKADVVVVGGGGGGSGSYGDTTVGAQKLLAGNGGGGGNVVFSTGIVVVPGTPISASIGAGGTAGTAGGAGVGGDGADSSFGSLTAAGGTGGSATDTTALVVKTGGGSGLTIGSGSRTPQTGGSSFTAIDNSGTGMKWSLGGGGAGASGLAGASPVDTPLSCPTTGSVASSKPGCGGQGYRPVTGLFAGETTYYGGGGGGGSRDGYVVSFGGYGGGGVGDGRSVSFAGTANTGGGGGGARADAPTGSPNTPLSQVGGAGGSGIVIIRYVGALKPVVHNSR